MQIFVKAFSRPFYLDRCLSSIRANVDGHSGVVVLDDGLPPPALERLRQCYPEVSFQRAPWADVKGGIVRSWLRDPGVVKSIRDRFGDQVGTAAGQVGGVLCMPPDMDPLRFWRQCIQASSERFIFLLEEDCWITGQVDLSVIEREMAEGNTLVTHLFMNGKKAFSKVTRRVEVGEEAVLEHVQVPWPPDEAYPDTYLPVSLAIFDRAFWLDCHHGIKAWVPEWPIHRRALDILALGGDSRPGYARVAPQILAHGFSLSVSAPPGDYGAPENIWDITDALTAAWLDERLYAMADFPDDFHEDRLAEIISAHFGDETAARWRYFRKMFTEAFDRIGAG